MRHTPGPWKICKEKPSGRYGKDFAYRIIGKPSNEYPNALRFDPCMIYSDGQINKGLAKANARLIAAAPQLLEAAKAALARFTEDKIEGYHLHHPVSLLETAINNAEGRR